MKTKLKKDKKCGTELAMKQKKKEEEQEEANKN
jgi:hypothetical protein